MLLGEMEAGVMQVKHLSASSLVPRTLQLWIEGAQKKREHRGDFCTLRRTRAILFPQLHCFHPANA